MFLVKAVSVPSKHTGESTKLHVVGAWSDKAWLWHQVWQVMSAHTRYVVFVLRLSEEGPSETSVCVESHLGRTWSEKTWLLHQDWQVKVVLTHVM